MKLTDAKVVNPTSDTDDIAAVQFTVGVPPNGIYDDLTIAAVRNFQIRKNLPETGEVDDETFDALFPPIPVPKPTNILTRNNVTVSGNLNDGKTIKLSQALLGLVSTGYLDDVTSSDLKSRGYDLDNKTSIILLQADINKGKLQPAKVDEG